jgi:hypothetical protein
MRGSPVFRALVAFLVFAALGPVIHALTAARPLPAPPVAATVAEKSTTLALTFTHAARRVVIRHLGKDVWSKDKPEQTEEAVLKVPWPKEGVELAFEVEWEDPARMAAMRVTLADADEAGAAQSIWGRGTASDVLVFH